MTKNGDVFELEDFIPVDGAGKIYTSKIKAAWHGVLMVQKL